MSCMRSCIGVQVGSRDITDEGVLVGGIHVLRAVKLTSKASDQNKNV